MSNTNFYKGFNLKYSYKLYRLEVEDLELIICFVRAEEREQIPYWLKLHYISIKDKARRMIGYVRCLYDFEVIDEDAFDSLYNAYSQMAREA